MARAKTANPVLDGVVDVPSAPATERVRVRLKDSGPEQRYRAGLGPFGRAAVEVAPTRAQLDALRADPFLIVEEA